MKLPHLSRSTRVFALWLPAMLLLALLGYVFLGAVPGALLTGDLIAAIAQLPVITLHAFAAVGFTWFFYNGTFRDIGDNEEAGLRRLILSSDFTGATPALGLLVLDFLRWVVPLCVFAIFFYPPR